MIVLHLTDDLVHGLNLGQRVHVGAIDDMHQESSVDNLLQGRPEGLDELGRQVPDESHGVGQNHRSAVVELPAAGGGFQRGEQRVLHQHTGPGQRVEQARFPGVGVADDRNRRHVAVQAPTALGVADLFHLLDLTTQLRHPLADPAAVGLDLGLAGSAGAHSPAAATGTTALTRHRLAPAAQPWQHVLHLSQFHLSLALATGGVLGEDVQDQCGAVDNLDPHNLLQGIQLRRTEFAITDHGVGSGRSHDLAQFDGLAGSDVSGRVGFVATLDDALEHFGAGGLSKRGQFGQAGVSIGRAAVGPHPDQNNAFQSKLAVFDLGDIGELSGQPGHPTQGDAILKVKFTDAGVGGGGVHIKIRHRRRLNGVTGTQPRASD